MFALTRKLDTLEKKLDCGFQRIEQKLDYFEKRLVGKFDRLDDRFKSFEQDFSRNVASLRRTIASGFTASSEQDALIERITRLERDVARLKANVRS